MKRILDYTSSDRSDVSYGLILVVALLTTELTRCFCFCAMFMMNHTTGKYGLLQVNKSNNCEMAENKIVRLFTHLQHNETYILGPPHGNTNDCISVLECLHLFSAPVIIRISRAVHNSHH